MKMILLRLLLDVTGLLNPVVSIYYYVQTSGYANTSCGFQLTPPV